MTSPALPHIPERHPAGHKGNYGKVLLIGGSRGMAGAISLSGSAALRSGAGLVSVAVPDRCLGTVASFERCYTTIGLPDDANGFYEIAVARLPKPTQDASVVACGPGMRTGVGAGRIVKFLCTELKDKPRVLDADALNCLAIHDDWKSMLDGPIILTPHPGEWERLTGVPASDREAQTAAAVEVAEQTNSTIVLKGSSSIVTDGQQTAINQTGNPGMATGGSGDVLTGVIAALLAQGLSAFEAAHLGTHVHGAAGDLASEAHGQISMTSADILAHLPSAFQSL